MNRAEILIPLKVDLEISTNSRDEYLNDLVASASDYISQEGIQLDASDTSDCMLIEMYAAWLYRNRRDNKPMPRSLRWALNNRLMKEKGRV